MRIFSGIIVALLIALGTNTVVAQTRSVAPDFTLKTADGKAITLSKLKGKVVLINFWATWCGPCRAEIPGFLEVYKKYRTRNFEIIGISLDNSGWKVVNPFVEKYKIDYPIVLGDDSLVKAYGNFNAIPTTFLVDKKGNVVEEHVGYLSKEDLEKKLKPLL